MKQEDISKIYVGSSQASAVYVGSNKIWPTILPAELSFSLPPTRGALFNFNYTASEPITITSITNLVNISFYTNNANEQVLPYQKNTTGYFYIVTPNAQTAQYTINYVTNSSGISNSITNVHTFSNEAFTVLDAPSTIDIYEKGTGDALWRPTQYEIWGNYTSGGQFHKTSLVIDSDYNFASSQAIPDGFEVRICLTSSLYGTDNWAVTDTHHSTITYDDLVNYFTRNPVAGDTCYVNVHLSLQYDGGEHDDTYKRVATYSFPITITETLPGTTTTTQELMSLNNISSGAQTYDGEVLTTNDQNVTIKIYKSSTAKNVLMFYYKPSIDEYTGRLYIGGSRANCMEFVTAEGNIAKIVFTTQSVSYMGGGLNCDSGTLTSNSSDLTVTWEGNAQSVKIWNTTNPQLRFTSIFVATSE